MPIMVDVRDASGANELTKGCTFYWSNPTSNQATLSNCGGFCTASSYVVNANATTQAQILANPTGPYDFGDTAWTAPGMPHISAPTFPMAAERTEQTLPPQPYIDITDGDISGQLSPGQPFNWYNPTDFDVTIENCGTWCVENSYTVPANSWVGASIALRPNSNAYAFTETPNAWDTPGMPHISAPTQQVKQKEVA